MKDLISVVLIVIIAAVLAVGCKVDARIAEARAWEWATTMGIHVTAVRCEPDACYWPTCYCDASSKDILLPLSCTERGCWLDR